MSSMLKSFIYSVWNIGPPHYNCVHCNQKSKAYHSKPETSETTAKCCLEKSHMN